jgi:hypothetical protein
MPAPLIGGAAAITLIVNELRSAVGSIFSALTSAFGKLKSTILDTVAAFRPFQVKLFERAVLDLKAVFGMIFLPVLQTVTRYIRLLATYFHSLPPAFRTVLQVGAKIILAVGAIATAVGALAGLATFIYILTPYALALAAAIGGLFVAFARTTGGANFLKQAWVAVEQSVAGLYAELKSVWAFLAPMREQLSAALSDVGDSLTELLNALKPLAALAIEAWGVQLKIVGAVVLHVLTMMARGFALFASGLAKIANGLGLGLGARLPDVSREQKSAFGLGAHGGTITSDVAGMKTKLEEAILANTGAGEEKEDPQKGILENTGTIADVMQRVEDKLSNIAEAVLRFSPARLGAAAGAEVAGMGERLGQILFGP